MDEKKILKIELTNAQMLSINTAFVIAFETYFNEDDKKNDYLYKVMMRDYESITNIFNERWDLLQKRKELVK